MSGGYGAPYEVELPLDRRSEAVRSWDGIEEESIAMETMVTETAEQTIIAEALAAIDKGLADMLHRELVSTDEVADLLLDVRSLLVSDPGSTN